jgi:DNA-directed RNA polymerase specialized sigma24 family protein
MHTPAVAYPGDLNMARGALSGDEHAARVFVDRLRPDIERYLANQCRRGDTRSIEKSREIAADVISDCFGAKDRPRGEDILLKLYHGQGPLNVWLRGVAHARLKSWWVSKDFIGTFSMASGEERCEHRPSKSSRADPEVVQILRIALESAFRQIEPYQLLFLRLLYLHGVKRCHLARIWGCHPAKIGRDTAAAVEKIRKLTLQYIRVLDPSIELRWEDCQAICDQHTGLLYGLDAVGRSSGVTECVTERTNRHRARSRLYGTGRSDELMVG